jgi:ABC-type multidrug transport system permease subunit
MAFLALTRKGWFEQSRQPLFYLANLWMAAWWVLPTALASIALVGPAAAHVGTFAALAGTDNYLAYATIGAASVLWSSFVAVNLGFTVWRERTAGTLSVIWTSPTSALVRMLGLGSAGMLEATGRTLMAFAFAWVLLRFPMTLEAGALVAVLVASALASGAFGIIWIAVVVRARAGAILINVVAVAAVVLAGPAYPATILPQWAQTIGNALPLTWIIRGLRAALMFGDPAAAWRAVGILFVMTVAYGAVGVWLFGVFERDARRRGHLEAM